jgi:hypothetical protein
MTWTWTYPHRESPARPETAESFWRQPQGLASWLFVRRCSGFLVVERPDLSRHECTHECTAACLALSWPGRATDPIPSREARWSGRVNGGRRPSGGTRSAIDAARSRAKTRGAGRRVEGAMRGPPRREHCAAGAFRRRGEAPFSLLGRWPRTGTRRPPAGPARAVCGALSQYGNSSDTPIQVMPTVLKTKC